MGLEIDTSGIDLSLKQIAGKELKVRNQGLKVAAKLIAQRLEQNSPYDPSTPKHLKDDVAISGINSLGQIKVGYGKETAWRAKFVEFGTMSGNNLKGQGFMQRTEQETHAEVMAVMAAELRKGLGM
jgi:HK97 gp10 family phage protein